MALKIPLRPLAGCLYLALTGPLLAAQPPIADAPNPSAAAPDMTAAKTADVCRNDLKTFDSQMEKDGYWLAGEGNGFGYPMGAAGYGMYGGAVNEGAPAFAGPGYHNARPGYEVRVLVNAANILARHGQQQPCEDVLTVTRGLYKSFLIDMQHGGTSKADMPAWRMQQIHAAVPVAGAKVSFRSDELLGVEVRSPNNLALGSVDDIVLSPETGKVAYLVIARGGIFGFDETHVPVPWDDFKATPDASLLVLDTTKADMEGAPQVKKDSFSVAGDIGRESQKVDAYWKARQPPKASN